MFHVFARDLVSEEEVLFSEADGEIRLLPDEDRWSRWWRGATRDHKIQVIPWACGPTKTFHARTLADAKVLAQRIESGFVRTRFRVEGNEFLYSATASLLTVAEYRFSFENPQGFLDVEAGLRERRFVLKNIAGGSDGSTAVAYNEYASVRAYGTDENGDDIYEVSSQWILVPYEGA